MTSYPQSSCPLQVPQFVFLFCAIAAASCLRNIGEMVLTMKIVIVLKMELEPLPAKNSSAVIKIILLMR